MQKPGEHRSVSLRARSAVAVGENRNTTLEGIPMQLRVGGQGKGSLAGRSPARPDHLPGMRERQEYRDADKQQTVREGQQRYNVQRVTRRWIAAWQGREGQ